MNNTRSRKASSTKTGKASRTRSRKDSSAKAGKRAGLWIVIPLCAIVITVAAMLTPYVFSSSANAAIIKIPEKATESDLRDTLERYFDSTYAARTFEAFRHLGRTPAERYGGYEIPEGTSPIQAARILSRGVQAEIPVTINGVRQLDTFIPRIAAKLNFKPEELAALLANSTLMSRYGLTPAQSPALFLNDTYRFYWTSRPEEVIRKLGANYQRFWTEANRKKAADLGLTPAEVVTIASITDEETQNVQEKGRIGRLYINRLQKGMKLQADPTVRFALKDFSIKRITGVHLSAPGPYNTYRVKGLPPGPIRTTSTSTIQAILDSAPSDDLYMCAKEDFSGTHNFASTYEEHKENARRYQKALDERGIK